MKILTSSDNNAYFLGAFYDFGDFKENIKYVHDDTFLRVKYMDINTIMECLAHKKPFRVV